MKKKVSAAIQINLFPCTKELQESRSDLTLVTCNSVSLGYMYWLLNLINQNKCTEVFYNVDDLEKRLQKPFHQ